MRRHSGIFGSKGAVHQELHCHPTAERGVVLLLLLLASPATVCAEVPTLAQTVGIVAPDGLPSHFGYAIAASEGTVVVGAPLKGSGAAYVIEEVAGAWSVVQKIVPAGPGPAWFGGSVAVSGDVLVVGAFGGTGIPSAVGAAYVFERIGGTFVETQKLTGSTFEPGFGTSVATTGDRVLVGAAGDGLFGTGSAYLYEKIGGAWTCSFQALPGPLPPDSRFGFSVAIEGDTMVIGAFKAGTAHVFSIVGGSWQQTTTLVPSYGEAADEFGRSVAISAGRIAVGARHGGAPPLDGGSVHVFDLHGALWNESARIMYSGVLDSDQFGISIALSQDTLLVGSPQNPGPAGRAHLFRLIDGTWKELAELTPSDSPYSFGQSVALDGRNAWTGAHFNIGPGGKVYYHDLSFLPVGCPCPGSLVAKPALTGSGNASPGGAVTMVVDAGPPLGVGFLVASTTVSFTKLSAECTFILGVGPWAAFPIQLNAQGGVFVPGTIPGSVTLDRIVLQAFLADPGVPLGFSTSNGLVVHIE